MTRWVAADPASMTHPDPINVTEADARTVLSATLDALRWAREWRENQQRASGPQSARGQEVWRWYCQGSDAAARHDLACVEEEVRCVLGLPTWEDDPTRGQQATGWDRIAGENQ